MTEEIRTKSNAVKEIEHDSVCAAKSHLNKSEKRKKGI